ncbi:PREDICTED: uncharacterized protein LOC108565462 [Nicrophorus vespilloides]|uniref:Uncharacterized protein LOC108565462 n=1 Tax=Nicrophorus vespilloides TaxID=110193 RepID=A0ABM1N0T4_NICVS|nr:PREDICTED: uncharacterized protein LOC108565462 [Nicrophorus vespilloides]
MHTFVLFSAILAVALCAPVEESYVDFAEDTLGNYKLSYNTKNSSRTEERSQDGKVVGSFTFLDTDGGKHTVNYVAAGEEGFNAEGADLPVAVPEPQDVIQSRSAHLALVEHEKSLNPKSVVEEKPVVVEEVLAKLVIPEIASLPAVAVPEEDADLAAAKKELLSAYAAALETLAAEYKKSA